MYRYRALFPVESTSYYNPESNPGRYWLEDQIVRPGVRMEKYRQGEDTRNYGNLFSFSFCRIRTKKLPLLFRAYPTRSSRVVNCNGDDILSTSSLAIWFFLALFSCLLIKEEFSSFIVTNQQGIVRKRFLFRFENCETLRLK